MTTRRSFLAMLGAAPVALPAVVKAAVVEGPAAGLGQTMLASEDMLTSMEIWVHSLAYHKAGTFFSQAHEPFALRLVQGAGKPSGDLIADEMQHIAVLPANQSAFPIWLDDAGGGP